MTKTSNLKQKLVLGATCLKLNIAGENYFCGLSSFLETGQFDVRSFIDDVPQYKI